MAAFPATTWRLIRNRRLTVKGLPHMSTLRGKVKSNAPYAISINNLTSAKEITMLRTQHNTCGDYIANRSTGKW